LDSAYFDSSVFLAIFNGEPSGIGIKQLLNELRRGQNKSKVCTSIITIQEISVLSFISGASKDAADNYMRVDRFARIYGITKDVALRAAELEAAMLERTRKLTKEQRKALSPRRKWDCFHIATAIEMRCRWLYSLDPGMLRCRQLIDAKHSLDFLEPRPSKGMLAFEKSIPIN
jgi:predicted nucleic acid-binding protein